MQAITAQQSRDARRELGLSQADVTKALDFNRQYLSEFETGFSTRLTKTQLTKLRTFYEDKINEANSNGESITLTFGELPASKDPEQKSNAASKDPETIQRTMLAVRHLTIDHAISNTQIEAILEKIASNDAMAQDALSQKATRQGLFDSEWSESTNENLKLVFGLFAESYVLMRHLQGRAMIVLEKPVEAENIKSVADLFANLFYAENGGLVADESNDDATGDDDKADGEVQS